MTRPKEDLARILVVDDEEAIRVILSDVLSEAGYAVLLASSGDQAIAMLRSDPPHMVITDMKMPGADGLEVVKAARAVDPGLPVVVVTGYASVDTAVELMKLGAADYIPKPFNIDHIRIVVARLLRMRELQRQANEAARYKELARVDQLTGLYNRRHFDEALAAEVRRAKRYDRPVSLMLFDLDGFKQYNDTRGHRAGDVLLHEFGALLKRAVRQSDCATRYGGDEFAVILPETDKNGMRLLGERLTVETQDLHPGPDPQQQVTASAGGATLPSDAADADHLVERADQALYRAKQAGRNRIYIWGG